MSRQLFRHVGIVVKDMQRQLKFYRDLLELEILSDQVEKGEFLENLIGYKNVSPSIIKLGINGSTVIELLFFDGAGNNQKTLIESGITHIALTVTELEKIYHKMLDNHIKFVSPPAISPDGKHKVCFCTDYENNYLELVERI